VIDEISAYSPQPILLLLLHEFMSDENTIRAKKNYFACQFIDVFIHE